jgi:hypothetical protein
VRPIKTFLRVRGKGIKKNDGGVNLTKIYGKPFVNVIMYSQYNNNMIIKKSPKKIEKKE